MRYIILFVIFLGITANGFSQQKEVAIIQCLQFYVKTSSYLDKTSFPAYTINPYFVEDISNEINYLCKQKFGVGKIEFALPDSIELRYGHSFNSWKKEKIKPSKNSISVFIRTTIKIGRITDTAFIYNFNTEVIAKNLSDKNRHKFSSKIPFITVFGEEITDQVEMGKDDFYDFYFDGIRAAFQEKDSIFEARYIYKPQTEDYKEFLTEPKIFQIERLENNYLLYTDTLFPDTEIKSKLSIMEMDYQLWSESFKGIFPEVYIYDNPSAKEGFILKNKFNKINYTVRLNATKKTSEKVFYETEKIKFNINKGSTQVGKFNYSTDHKLIGILNGKKYHFEWSELHNITEIYNNTKILALVKEIDNYLWIYHKEQISDDQLADLFTIIFANDFGRAIRQQVNRHHHFSSF